MRVNAEATGLLLEHCRRAKAALIMSTNGVYKPHPDPWHAFREDDVLRILLAQKRSLFRAALSAVLSHEEDLEVVTETTRTEEVPSFAQAMPVMELTFVL